MPDTIAIHQTGIYGTDDLCAMLDVSPETVVEARRAGTLRFSRKGRRVIFLGEWVLAWLRAGQEVTPLEETHHD
jgi:hypothetical protein